MTNSIPAGQRCQRPSWFLLLAGLGIGLFWAYWPTLENLAQRWSTDPQYSHGYVVPVFALAVLWYRRDRFPRGKLGPSWWGLLLLAGSALLRLAGAYFFIDWFDTVSLLPALAGVCVLAGGWPALGWAWPAVAFLLFMLPLPYQLEVGLAHPLQRLATTVSTYALQTLGLPAVAQGNIILIDDLQIGVLEACSGLGMLVTFFALSTAVAFVVRRPVRDKIIIFLSAVPIGVLMNLLRITVTGFLYRTADRDLANLVFHDLAGWLMMPLALLCLWLELLFLSRLFVSPQPTGPVPVGYARPLPALPGPARARPVVPPRVLAAPSEPLADSSLLEIP
jgi:exosortase